MGKEARAHKGAVGEGSKEIRRTLNWVIEHFCAACYPWNAVCGPVVNEMWGRMMAHAQYVSEVLQTVPRWPRDFEEPLNREGDVIVGGHIEYESQVRRKEETGELPKVEVPTYEHPVESVVHIAAIVVSAEREALREEERKKAKTKREAAALKVKEEADKAKLK